MTRAEEKVKAADKWILSQENGYEFRVRDVFVAGYETAEKDLAPTPDDIKLITKIHYEIVFKDTTGIKVGDVASEVLKRYLEEKK